MQKYGDWYTSRWWVSCYIWYSQGPERRERAASRCTKYNSPPPSTASVPTSYYSMWEYKGLKQPNLTTFIIIIEYLWANLWSNNSASTRHKPAIWGRGARPTMWLTFLESRRRGDVKLFLIDMWRCDLPFSRYSRSNGQNIGPKFRIWRSRGYRPQREEDLPGPDMYHRAKFHADRCRRRRDICNRTEKKNTSNFVPYHTNVWRVTTARWFSAYM